MMRLSEQFRQRAETYQRKAREAKSPENRQQFATIAARCLELASENLDVLIGIPLATGRNPATAATALADSDQGQRSGEGDD